MTESVQAAIAVNVMTAWAHLLIQASIALIAWAWLAFKRPKLFIWAFPCIAVFCAFLSYAYYLAYCTGARDSLFAQDSVYYVYLFVQPMLIAGLFILLHSFLFPIPVDHRMGSEIGFGFFFYFLIFMLRGQPQWSMSAIGIDTLDEIKSLSSIRLYLIDWFWTYAITGVLLVVLFFLFRRWPEFRTQAKRDATVTIIGTMAAAAVLILVTFAHNPQPGNRFVSPGVKANMWLAHLDFGTGVSGDKLDEACWAYGHWYDDLFAERDMVLKSLVEHGQIGLEADGDNPQVSLFPLSSLVGMQKSGYVGATVLWWRDLTPGGLAVQGMSKPVTPDEFLSVYSSGAYRYVDGSKLFPLDRLVGVAESDVSHKTLLFWTQDIRSECLALVFAQDRLVMAAYWQTRDDGQESVWQGLAMMFLLLALLLLAVFVILRGHERRIHGVPHKPPD